MMSINEISNWLIKSNISQENELKKIIQFVQSFAESDTSYNENEVLFELSKLNSLAGFVYFDLLTQKRSYFFLKNYMHVSELSGYRFSIAKLSADLYPEMALIYLKDGEAYRCESITNFSLCFGEFKWKMASFEKHPIKYSESNFINEVLRPTVISLSAMISGLKSAQLVLVQKYSHQRWQGGRTIKDWSFLRQQIVELENEVSIEKDALPNLSYSSALKIIESSDAYSSKAMQCFGGAGYTEDYKIEKYFRESIFFKNWIRPFSMLKMEVWD